MNKEEYKNLKIGDKVLVHNKDGWCAHSRYRQDEEYLVSKKENESLAFIGFNGEECVLHPFDLKCRDGSDFFQTLRT